MTFDLGRRRRVHVVGVGGAGMSAIATVLAAMGHVVSGSDQQDSPVLARLRAVGVATFVGHDAAHVGPEVEAVAVSSAVAPANPEVVAASARGVPVLRRAEVLAAIAATRRTAAVSGTHGKTTTSAMLALVLAEAGARPSFVVGGDVRGLGAARYDGGDWFVVEADESDGTFLELGAEAVVVTNREPDHLEHYGSFAALRSAFRHFLAEAPGPRVVCADDPVARELGAATGATTYGTSPGADYRMVDVVGERAGVSFGVEHAGRRLGTLQVRAPGLHNARNACAATVAALGLGAPFAAADAALRRYAGVARRFEHRGQCDGVTYVDDYAHLPGEVAAALAAARDGGWRRVVAVFQPHRYSRTEALWADFGSAFAEADAVVVTDVYPAGEVARPGVTGRLVADAVRAARPDVPVAWVPERSALVAHLRANLRPGDLCLTLGAGDVTTLADQLSCSSPGRGAA